MGQNKFSFCSRKVDHEGQKEEVQTPSRVVVYKGLELEAGSLHLFPEMMLIFYLLPNFCIFSGSLSNVRLKKAGPVAAGLRVSPEMEKEF